MPNNIAVSITAVVADLQVKRAIMSAELKAATKDLNDFAKTARTSGTTNELRASMLASAEAAAKARAQIHLVDTEVKNLGKGGTGGQVLGNVFNAAQVSLFSRGSAAIGVFGGALQAIGPAGLVAAAGLAAFTAVLAKAHEAVDQAAEIQKLSNTVGVSTDFIQRFNFALRQNEIDVQAGDAALQKFNIALGLVQSGLARSLQVKAFEAIGFTPEQLRQYHDAGELFPVLAERIQKIGNAAEQAAITKRLGLEALLPLVRNTTTGFSALSAEADRLGIVMSEGAVRQAAEAKEKLNELDDVMKAKEMITFAKFADQLIAMKETWLGFEEAGLKALDNVRMGIEALEHPLATVEALIGGLTGNVGMIRDAAKTLGPALHAGDGTGVPKTPGSAELAKQLVPPKAKKGGHDDVVGKWREQLQEQEVASGDFFKDQTAMELAFWQSKLALTKTGSKDWLQVQAEIFNLSKKLAHDAYDDHMADLDEQLGLDRDNWTKEKADWDAKLAFIASKFGERSKEYIDAHRQEEQAERDHQAKMVQIAKDAAAEQLTELKNNLATRRSIRQENARTAESLINENAKGTPIVGEVKAAQQIRALHQQLAQQEIADAQATYAAEDALRQQDVASALAAFGKNSTQYDAAQNAKKLADQEFYNQHRLLENQMVNQDIADQQKIRSAWHSVIDPMISTTGNQVKGLIEGTETWGQALRNIGEEALSLIIEAIERMVEQWIVNQIVGVGSTEASAKAQGLAYAGVAGAAGVASMAAAPFPIDLTAPAFGASMFADALAFAAFDKGTNMVPADMIAQVHAGERIIPAADNRQLMGAINDNRSSRGGDTNHIDLSTVVNGGGHPDVIKALAGRTSDLARILKGMHRDGHFRFAA